MNLLPIFLTGLFTGGLTCLAVQGGLLAATIAQHEEQNLRERSERTGHAFPIISFLAAKLFAYTVLGFLLGSLGSVLTLSPFTSALFQMAVAIFMIGTALNILNIHPVFRYFVIQPPKFITRFIRRQSKSSDLYAPIILGLFTVFIPCGTTQAMMALAIGSGNPVQGALVLFAFVLGTSPLFFTLGYFAMRLGAVLQQRFMKAAAVAIILLATYNLNGALTLAGSPVTLDGLWNSFYCTAMSFCNDGTVIAVNTQTVSEATITIASGGYSPRNFSVKAGSDVTINLVNKGGGGCAQAFTIPKFGIQKIVPLGKTETIKFTAPTQPQKITFACSMGMYKGTIHVI